MPIGSDYEYMQRYMQRRISDRKILTYENGSDIQKLAQ